LTITSLPEVTVANELTIASLPSVEISGLVSVTIPEAVTITSATPIEVVVVTAATTEVNLNAYNFYETPLTTLNVPNSSSNVVVYDISRSIDQTLFAHLVSGSSVIGQLIVSPTLNPDYFYPAGISQELSITSPNYPFVSNYFGRYVGVQFTNDTATDATVEVIAQSQGPITEE
ncbi:MAG: hypothetical protein II005_09910, partial [Turicibacter sp.]|nr:hypothetical protein [Turicibacter sp.]